MAIRLTDEESVSLALRIQSQLHTVLVNELVEPVRRYAMDPVDGVEIGLTALFVELVGIARVIDLTDEELVIRFRKVLAKHMQRIQ